MLDSMIGNLLLACELLDVVIEQPGDTCRPQLFVGSTS
jgi:hypothetical protein